MVSKMIVEMKTKEEVLEALGIMVTKMNEKWREIMILIALATTLTDMIIQDLVTEV
jgi:hypothetical protein